MAVAINLARRLLVTDDGTAFPITNMFDADGDETNDPSEAVSFVAGSADTWFSAAVSDFEGVTTQ